MASSTSMALPTAQPRGRSMSVISAEARIPARPPMETMASASCRASSGVFIKAPLPALTSSTTPSQPEASFLLITEEAISGKLSTVPVTSRRA